MPSLPAEIWKQNSVVTSKLFVTAKAIASLELDPRRETADIDRSNNRFPQSIATETFALTNASKERNPMQRASDEFDFHQAVAERGVREAVAERDRVFGGDYWGW